MTGEEARAGVDDVVLGSVVDDVVLGLLDRIDELKAEADKWQRAALTLQADRDAMCLRGDLLARDLGAAVVRADRAAAERDALAAKIERLLTLVSELTDDEPCSFDHNGECQAHGFLHDAAELIRAALDEEAQP